MRLVLTILLVLFASYADIFLYRRGIVPVTPAYFLIPLFMMLFVVANNPLKYLSLTKSHTFQFFAMIVVLSIIYANISIARPGPIITTMVLSVISLLLYWFAVHFFRTVDKRYLGIFLILAFITLSCSLWYDVLKGLPAPTNLVKGNLRKGGFAENPNTAASGIKFLGFALLFYFRKNKLWRNIFLILTVFSVFLTFSRSGIISVVLMTLALLMNNWEEKFNIKGLDVIKKGMKVIFIFGMLYLLIYSLVDILRSEIPELNEGDAAARIDQLLGKGDQTIINQDDNTQFGRNTLLKRYSRVFFENPEGMGTAFASDPMLNLLNTHNYYLYVGVEYGIFGLFAFLLFLFRCIKIGIKKNSFYYLVLGCLLAFEGLISHGMFEERAIILVIAFFDALIYPFFLPQDNDAVSEMEQVASTTTNLSKS